MNSIGRNALILFALFFVAVGARSAESEGWYGFNVEAKGKGRFWNPVIETITVKGLAPGSPAADSRIEVGDMIVAVEGQPVVGQRGRELAKHFERKPGSVLHLRLLTPDGEEYEVVLISAVRPEDD